MHTSSTGHGISLDLFCLPGLPKKPLVIGSSSVGVIKCPIHFRDVIFKLWVVKVLLWLVSSCVWWVFWCVSWWGFLFVCFCHMSVVNFIFLWNRVFPSYENVEIIDSVVMWFHLVLYDCTFCTKHHPGSRMHSMPCNLKQVSDHIYLEKVVSVPTINCLKTLENTSRQHLCWRSNYF